MIKLIERAKNWPERTAIKDQGKAFSYSELLQKSQSIAIHLLGTETDLSEQRVAFMVRPGFDYVAVQWGVWQAGGIAVPLCVDHPLPSLQYVIENTNARTLIVHQEYEQLLKPLVAERDLQFYIVEEFPKVEKINPLPTFPDSRRAMILYTSGTTNLPKGVVTTHQNIQYQIRTLIDAWGWDMNDHILNVLPLHHVHGIINVISCALWSGACVEFIPKFKADAVFKRFKKGEINVFMAVPTVYYKLISYWNNQDERTQKELSNIFSNFRLMVSGSAALPVSVLEDWKKISGHTLLERYGMTEIGMALSNPYRGERRPGHVGQPLPGVDIRLVGEDGVVVKEGEQGEIQVKGPNVFKEYWQNPEATVQSFTDGWFRTGDMAIWNEGAYRILGRNSVDIIKSGGYKISALEIEEVLRTHPTIKDCGVVGLANEEWGEIVAASLVCPGQKPNLKALNEWLKTKLPSYKIPRQYIFQEDLPRNTIGKVTKKALQRCFQD